jgi:putative phage-type endonuclease
MEQRTDEWFQARAGKITASRIADLMARLRNGKPSASRENMVALLAFERILGDCVPTYSNAAMQRGIDLEPEAIRAYEDREMVATMPWGFVDHPEIPMAGCSPDGLVGDDGLLEVKCPSAHAKHLAALTHDAHADEYKHQLQWQLACTGRQWVDIVSYYPGLPDHLTLACVRVERDEDAIAALEAEARQANEDISEIVYELEQRKPE